MKIEKQHLGITLSLSESHMITNMQKCSIHMHYNLNEVEHDKTMFNKQCQWPGDRRQGCVSRKVLPGNNEIEYLKYCTGIKFKLLHVY